MNPPYLFIGASVTKNWTVYSFSNEVASWIQSQPTEMWRAMETSSYGIMSYRNPCAISPELEAWMKLKWG